MAKKKPARVAAKDRRRSIVAHALSRFYGKEADRGALEPGRTKVQLAIEGYVGRAEFYDELIGELIVDHDTTTSSTTGPGVLTQMARLLGAIEPKKRAKVLDAIVAEYEREGELKPDKELIDQVQAFGARLRSKQTVPRRGNVVFAVASAAEAA